MGTLDPASQQILKWAAQHPESEAGTVRDDQGCFCSKPHSFPWNRISRSTERLAVLQLTKEDFIPDKADFLNGLGKKTRVAMRVSTVGGDRGSSDTQREAVGLHSNFTQPTVSFDLVGNVNGAFRPSVIHAFQDLNRSEKEIPKHTLRDPIKSLGF
ncbi:Catalase-A [Orchesella cincta]|uniref:Catalase-A n=1 Tax=Orchesella cincta TaxID=48709 RepID=A0A1D2MCN5_ORCCI|nr:Catalase-A [Orchesella cincta]